MKPQSIKESKWQQKKLLVSKTCGNKEGISYYRFFKLRSLFEIVEKTDSKFKN
jgi:hypothetical protein